MSEPAPAHRVTWFAPERPVEGTVFVKPTVGMEGGGMSRIYLHVDRGAPVRVQPATRLPDEYSVQLGEDTLYLTRDVALALRAALDAALAEQEGES